MTSKDNKIQHNKKRLIEAMTKSLGIVTHACKSAKVDRSTYYEYFNTDPEFKAAVLDIKEIAIDFVVGKLMQHINNGDITATIFYLKTIGKERGFVERQETQHSGKLLVRVPDEDEANTKNAEFEML